MLTRIFFERPTQPWLRWLVILGVLTLSAGLAYRGGRLGLLALLGVPVILGLLALLRRPVWGLLALLPTALLVPFEIGTGTQTTINAAVLLAGGLLGLWLLEMFVIRRQFTFLRSRALLPALGLALAAGLAFIAGQLPWFAFAQGASLMAQLGGLAVFLLSAGVFILAAHRLDSKGLARLTWLFLALGGLLVLGRLLPGLGRLAGLFRPGATGSVFWVWLAALSFSQALLNTKLAMRWRLALGGLTLAALYVGFIQGRDWASGWLPPLIAILAILILSKPRLGWPLALLGGAAVLLNFGVLASTGALGDQEFSLFTRKEAWGIVVQMIKVNPIIGFGPANYYWYTQFFPILGYYVVFNSHNQYIDLIAQTGILGLGMFLWLTGEIGWLGWRMRARTPEGFERAYVYGALGGLAGMLACGMLGDWVLPFVYNIGLNGLRSSLPGWLFLGGLLVIEQGSASKE
jgi:O-antigen ligase